MRRFTDHKEKWGEFVDIKINVPELLAREIKRKQEGRVWSAVFATPFRRQRMGNIFKLRSLFPKTAPEGVADPSFILGFGENAVRSEEECKQVMA